VTPSLKALIVLLLVVASTSAQTGRSWPIREAPEELRPLIVDADLAIVSMQDALLRQLREKLRQGGPELALGACHIDTAALARRLGRSREFAGGFTSDRLRDAANRPRPWAVEFVRANAGKPAREVPGFVVDLGKRIGVLRPIAQQEICASCHGPADRISPSVRKLLDERYPRDEAVGFTNGEIRGWFWVELSKPER
jgi:hypothetical protein